MGYFAISEKWLRSSHFVVRPRPAIRAQKRPILHNREPATSRGTLWVPPATASSYTLFMNRRQFLYTSAAGLALSSTSYARGKPRLVGRIGSGWYGNTYLFRLIQVAPVEVVPLCDGNKQILARAGDLT